MSIIETCLVGLSSIANNPRTTENVLVALACAYGAIAVSEVVSSRFAPKQTNK